MTIVVIAISSFVIALSGALVPGPLFTITVAESARRGAIAGPLIILGHGLLELVMIALLVYGITSYMTNPVLMGIGIVGGILLVLMGLHMMMTAGKASLGAATPQARSVGSGLGGHVSTVMAGVLGSLSNPYWTIWWVTIGVGYLVSALRFGVPGFLAFFSGHILADLVWFSTISLMVARGRRLIGDRGYRYLLYGCGAFLLVFGAWFLSRAGSLGA